MSPMPGGIRIVFMRRDEEEIRQSYQAFFEQELAMGNHFQERIDDIIAKIKNRKDVLSLDVFWYRDVIENPKKYFQVLKEHGWNIDVEKAVSVVNPQYYRFRKENLIKGII